jgi:hypothetical protein
LTGSCFLCFGATMQCNLHDTCTGIEYKGGFSDGTNECIMLRTQESHEKTHSAAGWMICASLSVCLARLLACDSGGDRLID